MIHRVLVIVALVCCAIVAASFAMFARDQLAGASKQQQNELTAGKPTTTASVTIHQATSQPRRFIDSAAGTLTAPFRSLVNTDSEWALHAIPAIIALLVYGVGLGYLARFSRGMS